MPPHVHAAVTAAVKTAQRGQAHTGTHAVIFGEEWVLDQIPGPQRQRDEPNTAHGERNCGFPESWGCSDLAGLRLCCRVTQDNSQGLGPSKQRLAGPQALASGGLSWSESLDLHILLCPDCMDLICSFNTIVHICNSLPSYIPVMWDVTFLDKPQEFLRPSAIWKDLYHVSHAKNNFSVIWNCVLLTNHINFLWMFLIKRD